MRNAPTSWEKQLLRQKADFHSLLHEYKDQHNFHSCRLCLLNLDKQLSSLVSFSMCLNDALYNPTEKYERQRSLCRPGCDFSNGKLSYIMIRLIFWGAFSLWGAERGIKGQPGRYWLVHPLSLELKTVCRLPPAMCVYPGANPWHQSDSLSRPSVPWHHHILRPLDPPHGLISDSAPLGESFYARAPRGTNRLWRASVLLLRHGQLQPVGSRHAKCWLKLSNVGYC